MTMLKWTVLAAASALALGMATAPASAEYGRNGAAAAGVVGGLAAGAILGGALAARPAPAPVEVYEDEPDCHIERRRVWVEGIGWRRRPVEVCE
jgi:hypothetical protein